MKFLQNIKRGRISPMGLSFMDGGINIAISVAKIKAKQYGVVFFQKKVEIDRVIFPEECRIGNMYAVHLDGVLPEGATYLFLADDQLMMDPYAKLVSGRDTWGISKEGERSLQAGLLKEYEDVCWRQDRPLQIPYEDTILYGLHLRGYTKHASSRVSKKGTFLGLEEKIPYMKELGITSVLCMPIYEFDEIIVNPAYQQMDASLSPYYEESKEAWKYRLNYWGFAEEGNYYFAPKASYAAGKDASSELKHLIRTMHENGIELLMQMYFSPKLSPDFVRDVLRFWVLEYHIDGFQLMGAKIPMELLGKDALLGCTKLIAENTMSDLIYDGQKPSEFRNLASYQDGFRCDARCFLKGDSDFVYQMSEHMKNNSEYEGIINHITDYRGFTLLDLVSYDRKHNEENGENNRDGSDYNYSWNCGTEGPSKKKAVTQLRLSQRKNAMAMLLLAQGTPLLLAGDEMGHTTEGNNNAYCHDSKLNYINWNRNQTEEHFYGYVRQLIAFRKSHKLLHSGKKLRMTDTLSCGFPDLSIHGQQAWQAQFENYNHHLAMLYCGLYESENSDFVYIAFNMHWIEQTFALPNLPKGYEWVVELATKDNATILRQVDEEGKHSKDEYLTLDARSTAIVIGKRRDKS